MVASEADDNLGTCHNFHNSQSTLYETFEKLFSSENWSVTTELVRETKGMPTAEETSPSHSLTTEESLNSHIPCGNIDLHCTNPSMVAPEPRIYGNFFDIWMVAIGYKAI